MDTLTPGQRFPEMQARSSGGGDVRLPDEVGGHTAVLLFYRGHW